MKKLYFVKIWHELVILLDKKQTKISPEILDVDSSRKTISLDGKKITQKHGLIFFWSYNHFFYFLFVLFFSSFLFIWIVIAWYLVDIIR